MASNGERFPGPPATSSTSKSLRTNRERHVDGDASSLALRVQAAEGVWILEPAKELKMSVRVSVGLDYHMASVLIRSFAAR